MAEITVVRYAKPIVSKRNHFGPADELVEHGLISLPDEYKHEKFRVWLTRYTERVIKQIASDFAVGAQRGIEQTANLLCDPEFYETRRKARANFRKQMQEQQAAQEWERIERKTCPTAEQIADEIRWREREIIEAHQAIARSEKRLTELRAMAPKNIRMAPKSMQ